MLRSLTRSQVIRASRWTLAAIVTAGVAQAQDEELAGTPRAALELFLSATRAGRYDRATTVFPDGTQNGPELARDLRAVMDEYIEVDPSKVSDSSDGKPGPTNPAGHVEIGRVPVAAATEPIRMQREPAGKWVFTPTTLAHVPGWYANLPDQWIRKVLPEPLLRSGPRDVLWWQWLALLPIALLSLGFGWLLAFVSRVVLREIAERTSREFDPQLIRRLAGPLILLGTVAVAHSLSAAVFFTVPAKDFISSLESALLLIGLFWVLLRVVDISIEALRASAFAQGRPERLALLPLFSKGAKITLGALAIVEALQRLGYPAASLIAGLGVGGLAVALAAQKTVENLFGSVMLGLDQPFRPGDLVQFDTVVGTVESIGLRSTRIRTAGRSVITMPNGRLSDMRIESFAPRDRMRLDFTLSLLQSTRADQLRKIIADIQVYLDGLPDVKTDKGTVYLTGVTTSSLDIAVGLSIDTRSDDTFQKARQEILLTVLAIVEANGTFLAMPARAVHMIGGGEMEGKKGG